MIWPDDVSFEGYGQKKSEWFNAPGHFLGDPPVDAQYALDLIYKTLVDDKEDCPYLTTMPESREQTNYVMLELILEKYSNKYRKYLRKLKKNSAKLSESREHNPATADFDCHDYSGLTDE